MNSEVASVGVGVGDCNSGTTTIDRPPVNRTRAMGQKAVEKLVSLKNIAANTIIVTGTTLASCAAVMQLNATIDQRIFNPHTAGIVGGLAALYVILRVGENRKASKQSTEEPKPSALNLVESGLQEVEKVDREKAEERQNIKALNTSLAEVEDKASASAPVIKPIEVEKESSEESKPKAQEAQRKVSGASITRNKKVIDGSSEMLESEEYTNVEKLIQEIGKVKYYKDNFNESQHNKIALNMIKLVEKFEGEKAKKYGIAHKSTWQIFEDLLKPDKDGFVYINSGVKKLKMRFAVPPKDKNDIKKLPSIKEQMQNGEKLQQVSTGFYRPEDIINYARHGVIVSANNEKKNYTEEIKKDISNRLFKNSNYYQFENLDGKNHRIDQADTLKLDEVAAKTIPDEKILTQDYGYAEIVGDKGYWVSSSDLYARIGLIESSQDSKHEATVSDDSENPKDNKAPDSIKTGEKDSKLSQQEFDTYKKYLAYQDIPRLKKDDAALRKDLEKESYKSYTKIFNQLINDKDSKQELESVRDDARNYFNYLISELNLSEVLSESEFSVAKSDSWILWDIAKQEALKDKSYPSAFDPKIDYSGSVFSADRRDYMIKVIAWRHLGYEIKNIINSLTVDTGNGRSIDRDNAPPAIKSILDKTTNTISWGVVGNKSSEYTDIGRVVAESNDLNGLK